MNIRRKLPRLGGRKLYFLVKPQLAGLKIKLGRDAFFDLLRENQLLITPKRQYTKTTNSKHWMKKHPNLYQGLAVSRPEQAFVSDITYVESQQKVHYLSLVTDAYSRKIVGYELSDDMKTTSVVKALEKAVKSRLTTQSLIHHSDRGLQYCAELYQGVLRKNGITPSMTDGYDCYQNALAERVNGILKQEFLLQKYKDRETLQKVLDESIYAYNYYRPHLSLGMKTPNEVHKKAH
jgi:transposase InsO family protein